MNKIETVKEHCIHKDCIYRRTLENRIPYCDYLGMEKKPRNCDISKCDKYKAGQRVRPKIYINYELEWERIIHGEKTGN